MPTQKPRVVVTLEPEMMRKLNDLKREVFYAQPMSAVIRYIMERGLTAHELDEARKGQKAAR